MTGPKVGDTVRVILGGACAAVGEVGVVHSIRGWQYRHFGLHPRRSYFLVVWIHSRPDGSATRRVVGLSSTEVEIVKGAK